MGWCAAFGCQNNSRKNKDKSFFLMPENKTTKNVWIKAINRTALPKKSIYSKHPLIRTPTGPKKLFKIANVRINRMDFKRK